MNTAELREALGPDLVQRSDARLSISSHVLRRISPEGVLVAVGGEHTKDALYALLDALHLRVAHHLPAAPIRVVVGRDAKNPAATDKLLQAIATMANAIQGDVDLEIQCDCEDVSLATTPPDARPTWPDALNARADLLNNPPLLATLLSERVDDPAFSWHAHVSSVELSGRVDGLEVCRVDRLGSRGLMSVGKAGSNARKRFEILSGHRAPWRFEAGDVDAAAEIVGRLIDDRQRTDEGHHLGNIEREHALESRVLRGEVRLQIERGRALVPVDGQFPTLWANGGTPRYLDVLGRDGVEPWAIELKVPSGGHGKYYRHAVGQVVLYREFIRRTSLLAGWFTDRDLDSSRCRAAVAIPAVTGNAAQRLKDVEAIAELFDVEVIRLHIGA